MIPTRLACSVCNPAVSGLNQAVSDGTLTGVLLKCADRNDDVKGYSDLCILTDNDDTVGQEYWYRGRWRDGCTTYWKNLLNHKRMPERSDQEPALAKHALENFDTLQNKTQLFSDVLQSCTLSDPVKDAISAIAKEFSNCVA